VREIMGERIVVEVYKGIWLNLNELADQNF